MIKFFTESDRHEFDGVVLGQEGMEQVYSYLHKALINDDLVGKDYEATGLDPLTAHPLLLILGDKDDKFVIDCTSIDLSGLKAYEKVHWLGQNIKYDISLSKVNYDMLCTNVADIMIIDQKLFQNCGIDAKKNPTGFRWGMNYIIQRHLGFTPVETDKSIRMEFVGVNPKTFVFTDRHINYGCGDINYLHDVYHKQMDYARTINLDWWLTTYELPLISVLMEAELEGLYFDTDAWKQVIKDNEDVKFEYACKLDEHMRQLRDILCTGETRLQLVGGKYSRKRTRKTKLKQVGLYGKMDEYSFYAAKGLGVGRDKKKRKIKFKKSKAFIDWNGNLTLLEVFAKLNLPLPLQGKAGRKHGYLIPVFKEEEKDDQEIDLLALFEANFDNESLKEKKTTNKKGVDKSIGRDIKTGKIVSVEDYNLQDEGWTTGKIAFQKYLVDFPKTPIRQFVADYNKFKRACTEISNFGYNYLKKVSSVTGRIHTIYRQANTVNGRLQSGGGKQLDIKYNSQNIPRDTKFRHCFKGGTYIDDNGDEQWYSTTTCDLSGAEVTFMCDKAEDEKLHQWAVVNDDSHSPMVQNVWRHIYLWRAGLNARVWNNVKSFTEKHTDTATLQAIKNNSDEEVQKWWNLANTFTVSKKVNYAFRVAGKNGTFGGIYGMQSKKAQETFNNTDSELAKITEDYEPVNVSYAEGKIILFAQRKAIPKTFAMVEANVKKGLAQGFIVLNDRSNSRIWLPEVQRLFKEVKDEIGKKPQLGLTSDNNYYCIDNGEDYEIDFRYKRDYDGQLRNVPISGTQADCLKEAMVEIQKAIRGYEIHCQLLKQVHDELVYSCPKNMDGQSKQWKDKPNSIYFKFDNPIDFEKYAKTYHQEEHWISTTQDIDGEVLGIECSFPKFVQLTMIQCANRYLNHYEMKADFEIKDSWTK